MKRLVLLLGIFCTACDGGVWLSGVVVAPNGERVRGASIRMTTERSGWPFEAASAGDGCFHAGGVTAPGRYEYEATIEASGFKPAKFKVRTLHQNHVVVTLQPVGASAESAASSVEKDPCETPANR